MIRKLFYILFISAVPLATIIIVAAYHSSSSYQDASFFRIFPPLLSSFASLTSLYTLCLIALFYYINSSNKILKEKIQTLENGNNDIICQNKELRRQIDILSAIREASLVLTQDVDFQTIIKKVLNIAYQLTCPISSSIADEITLFLKDEISGKLRPHAQRKANKVIFEEELDIKTIDWRNVNETLEYSRMFFASDGEMHDFTLPLIADRETVGVLKVKTDIIAQDKNNSRIEEKIKELQDYLTAFSSILALSVKTPLLYSKAITDGLTQLYTKRHLLNELPIYFEIASRHIEPFSMVMFDVDYFKKINDTYGHLTGDMVLKEIANILHQTIRKSSPAYRYGGEEIAIILPGTTKVEAFDFAERLRKKIEGHKFTSNNADQINVTISCGVAEYEKSMEDFKDIIIKADNALYSAKENGRNQSIMTE
ncbi:MAG: GGDEF domain-containing protein [Candidatus Brocadiia bacterium]